jgi:hypothetical protein
MPPIIGQRHSIVLQTRKGNSVQNYSDDTPPIPGTLAECAAYKRRYVAATHRPTQATSGYNCHGLTFASRRTNIYDSSELRRVLHEDEYQSVPFPPGPIHPGDIVLYLQNGDIGHSGVVVQTMDLLGGIRVLSKWGGCHEVVHMLSDCPYSPATFEFWRIVS